MFTYIFNYTIFWGIVINLIFYLKKCEDKRKLESSFSLDTYTLEDEEHTIVENYLTNNNIIGKKIIFSFKDNAKSVILLNVLNKLKLSNYVTLLYVTEDINDETIQFIEFLNDIYGFNYNIKTVISQKQYLNKDYKKYEQNELKKLYAEYAKKLDTTVVLHTEDQNSMCNDLLHNLFTNKLDKLSDKECYNEYTIYRPLFNLDLEPETESKSISDKLVEQIDTFKHHYPNWKDNLQIQLELLTKDFNNNTVLYLDNTVEYYKNGFVLNLNDVSIKNDKYCRTELKYLYSKTFEYYNIMFYDSTMDNLFSISEDNYCVKHDNWIFVFDNNRIIGMNYYSCQKVINCCEYEDNIEFSWEETETDNALISFLNGDFFEYYYIDEINDNTYENVFYENNIFPSRLLEEYSFDAKDRGTYHVLNN